MASEVRASITRELYPAVRAICGGGLPEKFDEWEYIQKVSFGTVDLNPEPPFIVDVDLSELKAFVKRTGQLGQTALDNYAVEKADGLRRRGH